EGSFLSAYTVAGVVDDVARVGVQPHEAGDLAVDTGFLQGFTHRAFGHAFTRVHGPARHRPVAVVAASDQQQAPLVVEDRHVGRGDQAVGLGGVGVVEVVDASSHGSSVLLFGGYRPATLLHVGESGHVVVEEPRVSCSSQVYDGVVCGWKTIDVGVYQQGVVEAEQRIVERRLVKT